ncbi:MAG: hypothetical protein JWP36_1102 [Paucimonas sp.]|nr:hypothetical protein [Paucimonas sp.]
MDIKTARYPTPKDRLAYVDELISSASRLDANSAVKISGANVVYLNDSPGKKLKHALAGIDHAAKRKQKAYESVKNALDQMLFGDNKAYDHKTSKLIQAALGRLDKRAMITAGDLKQELMNLRSELPAVDGTGSSRTV